MENAFTAKKIILIKRGHKKMEICKICELEGKKTEFKDGRGLGLHLKSKHNGMKLDEYRKKYGTVEVPIEEVITEEPESEEIPKPEESTDTTSGITITDYKLLNNSNLSAMFVDVDNGAINTFRKIIAIGNVEVENSSIISAMIIGDNGLLTPTFIIPGFMRIVERDSNELIHPKISRKKTNFLSKILKRKSKMIPEYKQTNENLSQELITQFSKHLQSQSPPKN